MIMVGADRIVYNSAGQLYASAANWIMLQDRRYVWDSAALGYTLSGIVTIINEFQINPAFVNQC